jgi:lipopolysaccharide/colanic/teichoic acid biosynthesis glycosyltransferase
MHTNSLEITKIGRIFRPFAMDELPQLFNIARGEMSFVGPRTYSIEHYGILGDFQRKRASLNSLGADKLSFFARLKLTPGLTGLAQIFAPKHAADEEVLRWDLEYLAKRSFSLDLWIIFISIWVTIRKKWEETTQKL